MAFGSERGFKKAFSAAGPVYVLSGRADGGDCIAFHKPYYFSSYELVVHQYFHLQANESSLPTWLAEGLAEYYSTVHSWGGKARVGERPRTVPQEGVGAWPTLRQLFDAPDELFTHVEGRAEEGNPRFAKSWELVRMLMLDPDYKDGVQEFAETLMSGVRPETAFQRIYGKDLRQVQHDLAAIPGGSAAPGASYPTDWRASEHPIDRRSVDQDEVNSVLADLSAALD